MSKLRLPRPIYALMLLAALVLAFPAWRSLRSATVVVEWSTASEMETAGFNLYRAGDPAGPFVQVNDRLIPASPDPLTGGAYAYEDHEVAPGMDYYYRLEEVENSGETSSYGPIEVRAARGGWLEFALVAGMGAIGLLGLALSAQSQTKAAG